MTFGAENFVKGPAILLTDRIQNLRLDGLLTFDRNFPRKLGRTNETGTLSRADERESEELGYEEIHGLVEQNKRPETHSHPISLAAKSLWNRRRRGRLKERKMLDDMLEACRY